VPVDIYIVFDSKIYVLRRPSRPVMHTLFFPSGWTSQFESKQFKPKLKPKNYWL